MANLSYLKKKHGLFKEMSLCTSTTKKTQESLLWVSAHLCRVNLHTVLHTVAHRKVRLPQV